MPESDRLNYFSEVETLVNRPLTPEPRLVTVAAIATATPEAIMAYSMAVAPRSSRRKRVRMAESVRSSILSIVVCLLAFKLQ